MPLPRIFFGQTGGGGGGNVNVAENGVLKVASATLLNFLGGTTVVNAGGGQADINPNAGVALVVDYHTVTALELAAKEFTLPLASYGYFDADMVDGAILQESVDYAVILNKFNWNGLGLDGIIAAGDIIKFRYAP